ncbi:MAG TPA: gamma carbonic anhydrase family protein [Gemmatimonadales bacterium]|nr:gamma carbonic anhydrase family protein [Gemmatimonadales bacterium]
MAVQGREAVINLHPTSFIAPGAVVLGDVTLGPHASVWYHAVLRGDTAPIVIGESSNIQDGSIVHVDEGVPATVGARVGVGHRVILHGCTIGNDCLIGMGSVVLNGVRVGEGSVVAAGAVVPEGLEIPPGSVVVGVPARVTRRVDEALRGRIRSTWEHYVGEAVRHRAGTFPIARASL